METWKKGKLEIVADGEHEVLMDSETVSRPVFDQITRLFKEQHGS